MTRVSEAGTVFEDSFSSTAPDPDLSVGENGYLTFGVFFVHDRGGGAGAGHLADGGHGHRERPSGTGQVAGRSQGKPGAPMSRGVSGARARRRFRGTVSGKILTLGRRNRSSEAAPAGGVDTGRRWAPRRATPPSCSKGGRPLQSPHSPFSGYRAFRDGARVRIAPADELPARAGGAVL